MSKKSKKYRISIGATLILSAIVLAIIAMASAMGGETTGDLTISGEAKVTGLTCKDTVSVHPALTSKPMIEHANTITANFQNDKLSSISLLYEGEYGTEQKAKEGRDFANVDYSLTLTKKYGEHDDIFSVGFSVKGTKMQMTQTARDISKINGNTVTYFLLDKGTSIAKSLEGLKTQYEAKGFSCEISE